MGEVEDSSPMIRSLMHAGDEPGMVYKSIGMTLSSTKGAVVRIARPSDDLSQLRDFYITGLGFIELGRFDNHDGFDGLMLGHPDSPYHLEFTYCHGHPVGKAPSKDHLMVFYIPDEVLWRAALERMCEAGYEPVTSFNPYWDRRGYTYEDPDGYRIVLQNSASPM